MNRNQRNIILIVVGVLVLLGAVAAGIWLNSQSSSSQYTGNKVKDTLNETFSTQPWYSGVEVTPYDGFAEVGMDETAASVAVNITVTGFTSEAYDDFVSQLPSFGSIIVYYAVTEETENSYLTLYGFTSTDFSSATQNEAVSHALSIQDASPSSYLKIQPGAVSVSGDTTDTTDNVVVYVAVDSLVPETVTNRMEEFLNENTDVIVLTSPETSGDISDEGSYLQTGAAPETAGTFQERLTFGLQFAEAQFTETNQITVSSVADEVFIEWLLLDEGQTENSLRETTDALVNTYGYPFIFTYKDLSGS